MPNTKPNNAPEITHLQVPKDGTVLVTVESDVTEQEIVEERETIVQRMHAAYLNLTDEMAEFQKEWDDNPTAAFIHSARDGWNQGGAAWLSDQAELFEKKTWVDLGDKIKEAAGTSYDRLAGYSKERYVELQKEVNKHVADPDDTFYNWAWWQTALEHEAESLYTQQVKYLESAKDDIVDTANSVLNTFHMSQKIYQHREAILDLPNLIAKGESRPIQAFVEGVLMDIDPELAKAIRYDPNFYLVLEVIADHDSGVTYLAYVGLMIEAIPPNFYGYVAGKGGAYVMIEVVMLIVTALLSAGSAVAARITMLVARFAANSAKLANIGKKLQRAKAAVDAFIRAIEDLSNAADDLQNLGAKLLKARSKPLHVTGPTRTTLQVKKESIKRDKKCRMCGSTQHSTPRSRMGTVVYK
ncbi:hypothetical protein AAKU55_000548 [Oxalobacteraceae bacterium GrIS 1.11]